MKKYLYFAFLFALASGACTHDKNVNPVVAKVCTEVAISADDGQTLTLPARVKAKDELQIAFRVSGTIDRVLVKEGQWVGKGQELAIMDDRDYAEQLRATEAEYESVKAEAERVIQLYEDDAAPADKYDKARYGLQQITSKLQHHRDQLADTRLKSPIDGYVQDIIYHEGETVGAGYAVMSIVGSGGLQVEASLPAKRLAERDRFADMSCTMETSGTCYPVSISGIKQKANASQLYTATFDLPAGAKAMIGEGCQVSIRLRHDQPGASDPGVKVPLGAILDHHGDKAVYVYSDGRVRLRPVETGAVDRDGKVLVRSGLSAGEMVVSSGTHFLHDGDSACIVEKPNPQTNKGQLL